MKALADICIVPIGTGVSMSHHVAACEEVLSNSKLKTRLHAFGTNVEGELEDILLSIRRCHEVVHEMGAPRITTTIKLSTRTDRDQSLDDKIESVEAKLERKEKVYKGHK